MPTLRISRRNVCDCKSDYGLSRSKHYGIWLGCYFSFVMCTFWWCPLYKYCAVTLDSVSDYYAPLGSKLVRVMF